MINGLTNVKFEVFFEFDVSNKTRGQTCKLKKNRFNSFNRDLCQHFFTERIINIWNKLDEQTVSAPTLNIFKGNLDRLRRSRMMGLFLGWWSKDPRGQSGSTSEAPSSELFGE